MPRLPPAGPDEGRARPSALDAGAVCYGLGRRILRERGDSQASMLSCGEQQQLSLAQAFLANPRLLMIDELSLGLAPGQVEPAVITPSQKRVPEGEKIRKRTIREREAKIDRHSRPKGEKKKKENPLRKTLRESRIDRNSRPRDQKPRS